MSSVEIKVVLGDFVVTISSWNTDVQISSVQNMIHQRFPLFHLNFLVCFVTIKYLECFQYFVQWANKKKKRTVSNHDTYFLP